MDQFSTAVNKVVKGHCNWKGLPHKQTVHSLQQHDPGSSIHTDNNAAFRSLSGRGGASLN